MTKIKNHKASILCFVVSVLILFISSIYIKTFAINRELNNYTGTIRIELKTDAENKNNLKENDFLIWKLSNEILDKQDIYDKIKEYSENDMIQRYGNPIREVSSKESSITIPDLNSGTYYLMDKKYKNSNSYYIPVVFFVDRDSNQNISLKHSSNKPTTITPSNNGNNNNKTPNYNTPSVNIPSDNTPSVDTPNVNSAKFIKVADNDKKTPLEGAVFKVTKKVGNHYQTLKKDNIDYIVRSGKDGRFSVDDLKYGEYYLWEITPPKGYKSLSGSVKFEVDSDSDRDYNTIEIENDRDAELTYNNRSDSVENTKRDINIPKTGDIGIFLLLIEGLIITYLGYVVASKAKKDCIL